MQSQFEMLTAEALKLTVEEREALVQLLAASLAPHDNDEEALIAELDRREANIESGATKVIPMDKALALVRAG